MPHMSVNMLICADSDEGVSCVFNQLCCHTSFKHFLYFTVEAQRT